MNPHEHFFFVPDAITQQQEQQFLTHLHSSSTDDQWTQLKRRRLILAGACPSGSSLSSSVSQKLIQPWITGELLNTVNQTILNKAPAGFLEKFGITPFAANSTASKTEHDHESSNDNQLNILINEYHPPNGILLHTDGPSYNPVVCIVSLESTVPLVFTPNEMSSSKSSVQTNSEDDSLLYDDDDDENEDDDENSSSSTNIEAQTKSWMHRASLIKKFSSRSDLLSSNNNEVNNNHQLQDARLAHPETFCVLLPPRSMIVFTGVLYSNYLHGILENFIDVIPRNKIANIDEQCCGGAGAFLAKFPVFSSSVNSVVDASSSSGKNEVRLFEYLQKLAKVKEIDRVDALNMEYDDLLGFLKKSNEECSMGVLLKQGEEEYVVLVREKSRTSLTYRKVKKM